MSNKVVDRDKSYEDRPDAEQKTAYHSKDDIEGFDLSDDRNGNPSTFFKGGASAKKDTSRKADQTNSKITKVLEDRFGSMYESGHMKKLGRSKSHKNVYRKTRKYEEEIESNNDLVEVSGVQRARQITRTRPSLPVQQLRRVASQLKGRHTGHMRTLSMVHGSTRSTDPRYYSEAENPQVASSPVTSDNPMLGMYAVNSSNNNNSKFNYKTMLETIAIQAAETFEALDPNSNIPETFGSELDQCTRALDRLHSYVTNNQNGNVSPNGQPVPSDTSTMPIRKEEYEEIDEGVLDVARNVGSKIGGVVKGAVKGAVKIAKPIAAAAATNATQRLKQVPDNFIRRTHQSNPLLGLFLPKSDHDHMHEEKLSKKQSDNLDINPKDGNITSSDLAAVRAKAAKAKLAEASIGILKHLVKRDD